MATSQFYDGKVWMGFPLVEFPASRVMISEDKDKVFHTIPGREGNVIDDVGSPAVRIIMDTEISKELLQNVITNTILFGVFAPIKKLISEPLNFFALLQSWQYDEIEIPFLSLKLTTIVIIKKIDTEWVGGKAGRWKLNIEMYEKLPFSKTSVLGRLTYLSLWSAYGLGAGEVL